MTRLGEFTTVDSGSGFPLAYQGVVGAEFPFLKVSDMNLDGNEIEISRWNHSISDTVRRRLRARAFPAGTVIFPKIGAAIATNKKRRLTRECCIDNNCMGVTGDSDRVDPWYLYYVFRAKDLSDFASDSNPPSIRKSEVEAWDVPLPNLGKQRRIVDLLSRAENIVRMRREAEQKAKEIIPALFLYMFGDPVTNAKGWQVTTFGDTNLIQIIDGDRGVKYPRKSDFSGTGDCLFLNTSNVRQGSWNFAKCDFISATKDAELRKGKLSRGDVILTTRGTLGNSAHYDSTVPHDEVRINSGMVILRANSARVLPGYLLGILNSRGFARQVIALTSGSAQPQLPIGTLTKLTFALPPKSRQAQFVEHAKGVRELEISQEAARTLASCSFQSLLAGVFGGRA